MGKCYCHAKTEEERKERRRESHKKAMKKWRKTHKEVRPQEKQNEYAKAFRTKLSDTYVFHSMVQRGDREFIKREDIPEEILDLRRAVITLKRILRGLDETS